MVQKVQHPHEIKVKVPGSKSITNRALLIAALSNGTSVLHGVLFSDDSRYFLQALTELGFPVEIREEERTVVITGFGGRIPAAGTHERAKSGENGAKETPPGDPAAIPSIYVGSAGTAARFLTAFLGLSVGTFRIDASEQMKARPMKELLTALEELGAVFQFEQEPYHFPFVVTGNGLRKAAVLIDVEKSSQFLSALLISSVLSEQDFTIQVTGTHGMAYVDMTVAMMAQFGAAVEQRIAEDRDHSETGCAAREYRILKDASYTPREYQIEPDLSAAGYFYAACPTLSVPVCVEQVRPDSLQGDIRFLSVLEDMGCKKELTQDGIRLLPPDGGMKGGAWELSAFSDQALTLAAIAPFAESAVMIGGIGHIRFQECDRVEAIVDNLGRMGIKAEVFSGQSSENSLAIRIQPGLPQPAEIETYDDHRVAMAFAVTGLRAEGIRIRHPACCRKTFEDFFEVLEHAVY